MSDMNALSELAGFVGKSKLSEQQPAKFHASVNGMALRLEQRPLTARASDLLGTVLALSARTRRVVQPRVEVELDVFTPEGTPALKIRMREVA